MLLFDVVLLLAVACSALVLGKLLRVPPMTATLLAGVLAGPGGLGLVRQSHGIEQLAELGVSLLLFGVGTEVSFERLRAGITRKVGAGAIQVALSVAVGAGLFATLGVPAPTAIVVGFLVSLSSTALVFKLFDDCDELDSPHGRAAAGVLLFQDLALIPMMLLLPTLAGPREHAAAAAMTALAHAGVALAVLLVFARTVLPRVIEAAARSGVHELFAPLALLVAFGASLSAQAFGLSLPLGAFLAGLALSGTPYAHRIFAELLPLRDAFVALFFTSVGMLCVPWQAFAEPAALLAMIAAVAAKSLVCAAVIWALWKSPAVAIVGGAALGQIGEFSFVLAREAAGRGLLPATLEQAFLTTAVASMAATPLVVTFARWLSERRRDLTTKATSAAATKVDVVVAGCGATGRAVANVLRATSIPFLVIELDPVRARTMAHQGLPVRNGDATRRALLEEAGAASCRAFVVAVSDPAATRRIVSLARRLSPHAPILVRAHRVSEIPALQAIGATEVIPAEFEASIEMFVRLLTRLGIPRHVARVQEGIIRLGNYQALRGAISASSLSPEIERLIRGGIIEQAEVLEGSRACGRTLGELQLRSRTGAAVLTIVRGETPIANPGPDARLEAGDLLVLYGPHTAIAGALDMVEPGDSHQADASEQV
ncbi:MAG: cation:proton antiporter [Deltaproteobacteria bacterium]|nr:cation:proton antiporter [Deltaproteobacteria bacterium]